MKLLKTIGFLFSFFFLTGCATSRPVLVETTIENFDVKLSRSQAFDASLVVAQTLNLSVAVLEKQSGLIRFEAATLSAAQLDQYCEYPFVNSSNEPWDTFQEWNSRSLKRGGGNVRGKVTINILITEKEGASNISMRSNWVAYNAAETEPCNSNKIFEKDFISKLKSQM